jgi:hypothetical protein
MNSSTSISDDSVSLRYIRRFLVCWLVLLFAPALLVIAVDPYQALHRSFLQDPPFYRDNERYQVPGLIDQYLRAGDFDSAIIGSSLSSNFTTDLLQEHLGWRAINLSVRASTLGERAFIFQRAVNSGKLKHVLFEINPTDFVDEDVTPEQIPTFPAYLYQDSFFGKWRYFFNQTTVFQAAAILLRDTVVADWYLKLEGKYLLDPDQWGFGVERWSFWMDGAERADAFAKFNTRENRQALKADFDKTRITQLRDSWEWQTGHAFKGVRQNLVDIVRSHPEVEFRIWFGAVSMLRYSADINMDAINKHVEVRRFIVNELADLPNVKIYSFDNDADIVSNLDNYMDVAHFSRNTLNRIATEISRDTHRLNRDNIAAFCDQFRKNILEFDVTVPDQ